MSNQAASPQSDTQRTSSSLVSVRPTHDINVPWSLLLDPRLTPMERNAWLVFRATLTDAGAPPSLERLRRLLACSATNSMVSPATAKRSVCLLRITRWIHLVGQRLDPLTGEVLHPLYAVHNEPASCADVCAADPGYIDLLARSLAHPQPSVRTAAASVLAELADDPALPMPLRKRASQVRATPAARESATDDDDDSPPPPSQKTAGASADKQPHSDDTGHNLSAASPSALPVRTYKETSKEVPTYRARARESAADAAASPWPSCLQRITPDQQRDLRSNLHRLSVGQQQEVLAELEARSRRGTVRDAVAYLFGLIRRVLNGEFRLWAGRKPVAEAVPATTTATPQPSRPAPSPRPTRSANPQAARVHLERIRKMLRLPDATNDELPLSLDAGARLVQRMPAYG